MDQHLVLASASPQRKRLLEGLGLVFKVHPSNFDESTCTKTDPVERAAHQAYHKAMDINDQFPDSFVIGCDTLVVSQDGVLMEKAPDSKAAREMVQKLSGKVCNVHSALSIVDPEQKHHEGVSSSAVRFKELTNEELDWWMGTNLWKDRSGSFQIDGPGQFMIEELRGDWSSVVGLPIFLLGDLLKKAGYHIFV